jgi:xylulokinase
MTALVGLDVGTTGVKALALAPGGEILGRAEAEYPLSVPRPGWAEQDPEDWWRAAENALAALNVDDVAGIGLSGQMHGLVVLDGGDRVLRPAILWNDGRTGAECDELEERVGGRARLVELTGNRALAGFTAPKLLWLRNHEPETFARIAHLLLPKDYVRLRLTGERAIDVADASGTLLLDVGARRWSDEVLAALDLPAGWLPPVLESPEVSGTADGVPVAAGAGDQAAGGLGVGVDRPGPLSVAMGTSGVVFAALPEYRADPQARVHAFCHAVPGAWHQMGVMLSAAGSLAWLRGIVGGEFDALVGERTPHADPDARGAFTGLEIRHDRGALVRAVLEGVACGLRDSFDLVGGGERGRVSGGGARSELWLKIVASVLEIPLERLAVEEGAAYGAALLGGVAGGLWGDVHEAVAACVRTHGEVEPVADWIEPYRALLRRYRVLYPRLSS